MSTADTRMRRRLSTRSRPSFVNGAAAVLAAPIFLRLGVRGATPTHAMKPHEWGSRVVKWDTQYGEGEQ